MSERKTYYKKIIGKTISVAVKSLLDSPEFSERYLIREDRKEIDKETEQICGAVTDRLVDKLEEK
jgi:hypothetical protein